MGVNLGVTFCPNTAKIGKNRKKPDKLKLNDLNNFLEIEEFRKLGESVSGAKGRQFESAIAHQILTTDYTKRPHAFCAENFYFQPYFRPKNIKYKLVLFYGRALFRETLAASLQPTSLAFPNLVLSTLGLVIPGAPFCPKLHRESHLANLDGYHPMGYTAVS